jgi:hypothetical protein
MRKGTFGTMALGPDCRIYLVSRYQQSCMNVILYPNRKGKDCGFIEHGMKLPYLNNNSIPNFPHYRIDAPYPCDSTIQFSTNVILDYNWSNAVIVYPNPSKETIYLKFPTYTNDNLHVEIIDINGRIVSVFQINEGVNKVSIDVSCFVSGLYFYSISSTHSGYAKGKILIE